jgi:uncharacterized protein (TIGR02266 family)
MTMSRTARESLARGLNALQADPSVPSHLVDLAAPIAQAMGALHQLERTGQISPYADVALNHVRGALAQLQSAGGAHPAVKAALDAVAHSLSLVHTLSRSGGAPPPPAFPPGQAVSPQGAPPIVARPPQAPPPAPPPPPPPPGPPPVGAGYRGATAGMAARPPAGPTAASPMVARDPFAAPAPGPGPGPGGQPATPSMPVPAPPAAGNMQNVAAELGAHSPTNFYKGLAGNDIVDHGGLFVSTYVSPRIGTPVRLKVSLPGGYEFEANAVVKWTREQGGDAPPGFGAQFTAITNEARQLVYRYVRNREPIFYDDL